MIYICSDLHFGHSNVIRYSDRPYRDATEMREQLITNWNKVVKPDDIVYHLGDFIFGNKEQATEILSRLNGYKINIRGNHDNHSSQWYIEAGFNEMHNSELLDYNNIKILLTHQPYKVPEEHKDQYDLHFYGHVHDKGDIPGLYPTFALNGACLCVERINYTPISIDEVIKNCKKASSHFNEVIQNAVESDK